MNQNIENTSTKRLIHSVSSETYGVEYYFADHTGLLIDVQNKTIYRMQRIEQRELRMNEIQAANQQNQSKLRTINTELPAIQIKNNQQLDKSNDTAYIPASFKVIKIESSDITPEEQIWFNRAELVYKDRHVRCNSLYQDTITNIPNTQNINTNKDGCLCKCLIM